MEWLKWMLVTSIPLRQLDESDIPIGFASACLIDYRERRFLLSVQHAVKMQSKNWTVDLGYTPGKGTAFYRPNSFNYVAELTQGESTMREVDFCYTEVPVDLSATYQHRTPRGIFDERPCHIFQTDLTDLPVNSQIYAFSGEVKPEQHGPQAIATEKNVYPGLRYLHTDGEFHIFQLPVEHPGHEYFKGCSGAPIVDMNKKLVALVCSPGESANTIRGVSLARYKLAFDFICEMQ